MFDDSMFEEPPRPHAAAAVEQKEQPHCSLHKTRWAKYKGVDTHGDTVYLCRWCGQKPPKSIVNIAEI